MKDLKRARIDKVELCFVLADLQARAADLVSNRDAPVWVAVTHYGWRSRLLSAFPNATVVKPAKLIGTEARSISHWSPYDRVGVVNADP